VRDHGRQALAYVYFEDEPGRRSAAKLLSKDEVRRIAAKILLKCRTYLGGDGGRTHEDSICSWAFAAMGRL
jgi:hypothetical protein